jgi:hypothetical protein
MVRYGGPLTAHTIELHGGLYLAILMVRYKPKPALTIALLVGL